MKHLSGKTRRRMLKKFKREVREMATESAKGPWYPAEKICESGIVLTSPAPFVHLG